jgi:AP endonuclease-1
MSKRKVIEDSLNKELPEKIEFNDDIPNSLKLVSWNVAGIKACLKKGFHKYLSAENPDILCLQETKLQKDDQYINFKDYPYQYQSHSTFKKGYSGTAIFSKIKPIGKAIYKIGDDELDNEGRFVILEFETFILINSYILNAGSKLERLDLKQKHYIKLIEYLSSLQKPIIVTGDLNVAHTEIDLARPKTNTKTAGFTPQERSDFTRLLEKLELVDTVIFLV